MHHVPCIALPVTSPRQVSNFAFAAERHCASPFIPAAFHPLFDLSTQNSQYPRQAATDLLSKMDHAFKHCHMSIVPQYTSPVQPSSY